MKNGFVRLSAGFEALKDDAEKFYGKGNKAAGTRLRVGLSELGKQIKEVRQDILDRQKG